MSNANGTGGVHSQHVEVDQAYDRLLAGTAVRSRYVELGGGGRVHLLEKGAGPAIVLLHGTGNVAGFFLPLLAELEGVRVLVPDRPGVGLSDPIDLPRHRFRESATAWLDRLLDVLELKTAMLVGHSGGGRWALWYALAHPDRVERLVLIGPPGLPKSHCPWPLRIAATPGLGEVVSQLAPPTPKSVLRFAHHAAHERAALAQYPDQIDLMVASGRDPLADRVTRAELRVFVSPFALLSPTGFRRRFRVRPKELRQLTIPTLVIWGERERLGSVSGAAAAAELIPRSRLRVLAGGHAPWLGTPAQTAAAILDFMAAGAASAPATPTDTRRSRI